MPEIHSEPNQNELTKFNSVADHFLLVQLSSTRNIHSHTPLILCTSAVGAQRKMGGHANALNLAVLNRAKG